MIAAAFVRRTRFDPLHEAASEQRLWDGLPGWLAALDRDADSRSSCRRRAPRSRSNSNAR